MPNLGKLEIQNLLDSELMNRLEEMAAAAYPELLQNAKATDEKRRIAENTQRRKSAVFGAKPGSGQN